MRTINRRGNSIYKLGATTALAVSLTACVTAPVVNDALGSKNINGVTMGCKQPYKLTQDCSVWSGAKRLIRVSGEEIKIAGSEDGSVVLVMDPNMISNNLEGGNGNDENNAAYSKIKEILNQNEITINKTRAVVAFGTVAGYVLELDRDGYSVLKLRSLQ